MFSKELDVKAYYVLFFILGVLALIFVVSVITTKKEIVFGDSNTAISSVNVDVNANGNSGNDEINENSENNIKEIITLDNSLKTNCLWSGSFQLLLNEFTTSEFKDAATRLSSSNKELEKMLISNDISNNVLSSANYYNEFAIKSADSKKTIVDGLNKKFKFESQLLESIEWDAKEEPNYILYSMLNKSLTFTNDFIALNNPETFADKYENISYFGIDSTLKDAARKQVSVLYYDDAKDLYAISLTTKQGDVVTLVKNIDGNSLNEIYNNLTELENAYKGSKIIDVKDSVKIPNLNIDLENEFTELKDTQIVYDGEENTIANAIQEVKFNIDLSSSKNKSDELLEDEEGRKLYFDSEFSIFVNEAKANKPYFAAKINNIELFQ